jgi:hypothetical protein
MGLTYNSNLEIHLAQERADRRITLRWIPRK